MKTGPPAPRVWLNANAAWEALDRLNLELGQVGRMSPDPGKPEP